jgi:hypothetical protein
MTLVVSSIICDKCKFYPWSVQRRRSNLFHARKTANERSIWQLLEEAGALAGLEKTPHL